MIVAAYLTRTSLSLSNLNIKSATHDMQEGFQMGTVPMDRVVARSAFMHGSVPVHEVMGDGEIRLGVNTKGADQTALSANAGLLIAALRQPQYELHVSLDGVDWAWTCFAAEVTMGSVDDRFDLLNQEVLAVIPRHPTPVAGPF